MSNSRYWKGRRELGSGDYRSAYTSPFDPFFLVFLFDSIFGANAFPRIGYGESARNTPDPLHLAVPRLFGEPPYSPVNKRF